MSVRGACHAGGPGCGRGEVRRTGSRALTIPCTIPEGGRACYTRQVDDRNELSYAWGRIETNAGSAYGRTGSY